VIWASKSPQRFHGVGLKNDERMKDGAGHASRSSGLLHLEASRARVS
jgi:hypothetical protein